MKKFLLLLAALVLMASVACAEAPAAVPTQIVPLEEGMIPMADAIAKAEESLEVLPDNCQIHAELVKMTDDTHEWIVSIFDLTNFTDAWSIAVDAKTGEVLGKDATNIGFFTEVNTRWVAAKGIEALWTLEDKLLYDTLYAVDPTYGMPSADDMSQGEALVKAMAELTLTDANAYEVGYGYIAGSAENKTNGVWEVYFVQNGEVVYKVNLDAVTGDIYLVEPDMEGNG